MGKSETAFVLSEDKGTQVVGRSRLGKTQSGCVTTTKLVGRSRARGKHESGRFDGLFHSEQL